MTRSNLLAAIALLLLLACSSKKDDKAKPPVPTTATPTAPEQAAPTGMPPGPYKIEQTQLKTLVRKSAEGDTHNWQALAGIEVTGESIKQLYVSRGSFFVSFKAQVKVGMQDCLLRYKTDLIEGPTGRGESVAVIAGSQALPAGETLTVSGVVALSSKDAAKIGSASAGYWTLCGADMPTPNAHDLRITKSDTEEIELGNAFKIHHSVIDIERPATKTGAPTRCHFNVVAEDVDASGYTLNRDFASYSLAPAAQGQIKLRRTAFEGGSELDFVSAVASKRSYLDDVSCDPVWDAKTATIEGIGIDALAMYRYQPEAAGADQLARATYDHSVKLTNKTGKDCSFRVRYRMLDQAGFAMHKSPVLSDVLHLGKGASASYRSDKHRLYTWLDQADDAARLVVQEAGPLRECMLFDPNQALELDPK